MWKVYVYLIIIYPMFHHKVKINKVRTTFIKKKSIISYSLLICLLFYFKSYSQNCCGKCCCGNKESKLRKNEDIYAIKYKNPLQSSLEQIQNIGKTTQYTEKPVERIDKKDSTKLDVFKEKIDESDSTKLGRLKKTRGTIKKKLRKSGKKLRKTKKKLIKCEKGIINNKNEDDFRDKEDNFVEKGYECDEIGYNSLEKRYDFKDFDDFKKCIEHLFKGADLNKIDPNDLIRFFNHYRENKDELLDKDLHYILIELLSSNVDKEPILKLLMYKFCINEDTMEDVNENIIFQNLNGKKTIYYQLNGKMFEYRMGIDNIGIDNIGNENIEKDLKIILLDVDRTKCNDYNFSFEDMYNDENKMKFESAICKILVNFILNHPGYGGYTQGMNVIAKFFVFLTTEIYNGELVFDIRLAYNLFYKFVTYCFKNIVFKEEYKNENIRLIDMLDESKMSCIFSKSESKAENIFNKISPLANEEKYKVDGDLCKNIEILKKNIKNKIFVYIYPSFATNLIHNIHNFNVSKSVILLLMLLDNHSLILDIISLYASKTSEDVCKKLEDEKYNHDNLEANLLMLDSFLDKISNFK